MIQVLGVMFIAFSVLLVVGAISGRVKVRKCCGIDPRNDLRMRGAYEDERTDAAVQANSL